MQTDDLGYPAQLGRAPGRARCGNDHYPPTSEPVYHESADAVRLCHDMDRWHREQAAADAAAEMTVERHFEDRGYWEARAQDDYEARAGVIPFDVAYRMACPELFADDEPVPA